MEIKQIAEGWWNRFFKPEDITKQALERMEICNVCEYKDIEGNSCITPFTSPCCSICGCPIASKSYSPDSVCPKNKWFKMNLNREENG